MGSYMAYTSFIHGSYMAYTWDTHGIRPCRLDFQTQGNSWMNIWNVMKNDSNKDKKHITIYCIWLYNIVYMQILQLIQHITPITKFCVFLRQFGIDTIPSIPPRHHRNTAKTPQKHQNMSKTPKTSPNPVKTLRTHHQSATKTPTTTEAQQPPKHNWQITKTPAGQTPRISPAKGVSQKIITNIFWHNYFFPIIAPSSISSSSLLLLSLSSLFFFFLINYTHIIIR